MNALIQQATALYPQDESFCQMLKQYLRDVDADVLNNEGSTHVLAVLKQHYDWVQQRPMQSPFHFRLSPFREEDQVTHLWVVGRDVPFLIDSLQILTQRYGLSQRWMSHPVVCVRRDDRGVLTQVATSGSVNDHAESWIVAEFDVMRDATAREHFLRDLHDVLSHIHAVHQDRHHMVEALLTCKENLDLEEQAYVDWLLRQHFVFLGCCDYDLIKEEAGLRLKVVPGSGLGVMRERSRQSAYSVSFDQLDENLKRLLQNPDELVVLNKAEQRSSIHRSSYFDFIGIKRLSADGRVLGERRILGLYTRKAWQQPVDDIPLIRLKCQHIRAVTQYSVGGHKAKLLEYVLDNYPLDELFETEEADLEKIISGMVQLHERPRTRVFIRKDRYHRYVSAFVYVPRDVFSGHIRRQIQTLLLRCVRGQSLEYNLRMDDNPLVLIHYVVHGIGQDLHDAAVKYLEQQILDVTRNWESRLILSLGNRFASERVDMLLERYKQSFSGRYRASFSSDDAAHDIELLEQITDERPIVLGFHQKRDQLYLKVVSTKKPVALFSSLPILENMGLRVEGESSAEIVMHDQRTLFVSNLALDMEGVDLDAKAQLRVLQVAEDVMNQKTKNDGFNRLAAVLDVYPRDIHLLRAWCRYLKQAGFALSLKYMQQCLVRHAQFSETLVRLFYALFDPDAHDAVQAKHYEEYLRDYLGQIEHVDDDKTLQALLQVVVSMLRANYWQNKHYVSFKLHSKNLDFLPLPRPLYEIWVCSARMEGVHLRGSKVARGGIRWSDRMEDFRTEVLGLVKAQMVKNAVIIPTGSKGGFVGKQLPPPSDREAWMNEGIACYKTFISGLLDITDNLVWGEVRVPDHVVRRDGDDPYLVVAADKGTATFSDIANDLARDYQFWLGDAFASGGSVGYDHKKMGITARGAWESARRHFHHLGVDIQNQDFTVIGIGDMAGDVFGNGMLLSERIRLLAAFNHMHIFLDPNPDAAQSFAERERLFHLSRSTWDDYDKQLISQGGGVFERSAKSITLSPEVSSWLGLSASELTPNELIHAILKAPADLLYNGGIGTYIKASHESQADAKDRANDPLRVDGSDLQVKVVVEGGNLGSTQLGRVEFAQNGGLIYTDAIDNSAGVDCSDHEVNIKILLRQAASLSEAERNALLASMTDEVARLVLRNNKLQTQILAVDRQYAVSMLQMHLRMIRAFEQKGLLNRDVEYLPNDAQLEERQQNGQGLTTPELAVLLAYSKMDLDHDILASDIPDDPHFEDILIHYFPAPLQERFRSEMQSHRLRREIIANQLANYIINRMGMSFVFRAQEELPTSVSEVVRAWWVAMHLVGAEQHFRHVESLDGRVSAEEQVNMLIQIRTLVERLTKQIVRRPGWYQDMDDAIQRYQPAIQRILAHLCGEDDTAYAHFDEAVHILDVVEIAKQTGMDAVSVAEAYSELAQQLGCSWLNTATTQLPRNNRWQALARNALRDDLFRQQRLWLERILAKYQSVTSWTQTQKEGLSDIRRLISNVRTEGEPDLAMLSTMLREMDHRVQALLV